MKTRFTTRAARSKLALFALSALLLGGVVFAQTPDGPSPGDDGHGDHPHGPMGPMGPHFGDGGGAIILLDLLVGPDGSVSQAKQDPNPLPPPPQNAKSDHPHPQPPAPTPEMVKVATDMALHWHFYATADGKQAWIKVPVALDVHPLPPMPPRGPHEHKPGKDESGNK